MLVARTRIAAPAAPAGGQIEVHVKPGSGIATSGAGVLHLHMDSAGNVSG
jgi:hypothetical protein